jgi:ribonuclease/clavin/mitogillin
VSDRERRVRRVPVPVETLAEAGTTNAYLVGTNPAVLVDPAADHPDLRAALADRAVGHVVVTHAHPDHVGGVGAVADGAVVHALAGRADRFERATGVTPDRTFRPGDAVVAGDGTALRVLDTPGHAPDHVAFLLESPGDVGPPPVLAGDVVVAEGSVVVGAEEGDMRAYLTSLRRLSAHRPPRLFPGHGPVVASPRRAIARLLDHRLDRERRVLAAVRAGAETPDAVVDAAYEKDLAGVREYARSTVVAHLRKLAVEGRVAWDGERAAPA